MKKVLVCLAVCLVLAAKAIHAQEVAREWDNRWFISPLTKFQIQEFGMLEKNKHGFVSNANELPIMDKINASFAASAYKNIVGRLSFSVDIGLAYGHVTSKDRLISTTKKETYNLLNATLYYHLLSHRYRLQPFISAGINNLINDSSYTSAPMGVGLKFTSKKIMIMGQAAYGYSVSKNMANTLMYSVGMYIGINNKKKKKSDKDKAAAEQAALDSMKLADSLAKKPDSSKATIINNYFYNVNVDSLLKAQQGANGGINNGATGTEAGGHNNGNAGVDENGGDGSQGGQGSQGNNSQGKIGQGKNGQGNASKLPSGKNKNSDWSNNREDGQSDFGDSLAGGKTAQAFDLIDYQVDTINGKQVIKFTVYFYYKDFSLTSRAFGTIDKVITQLKNDPTKVVDIKGYTDNVGSTEYNNFLSMRRAQMAFNYMTSRGIAAERLIVSYYGKEYPVAENTPAHAWLNRRVEVVIHDKD
ncbi:OmpA family protein [Paraflavitalea pollutisoli]|uniref:OmpA family protein n=1 Tax=Paraflavitalea pollutisoli TaxID=3034143 RepID=UPI0023EC4ABC|nr:OmpA family protein [Paraflavitalea sp. H1-2-19X]